jgi:predicted MPP superfamily phosphohydrolase
MNPFRGTSGARRFFLLFVYLAAAGGIIAWCSLRTVHIGRMVLPRSQTAALAAALAAVATLVLLWSLLLVRFVVGKRLSIWRESLFDLRTVRAALLVLLAAAPALYGYGRFIETRWTSLKTVTLGRVPAGGPGPVRLAVVSDFHVENGGKPWATLAQKVNAVDPDVILFLGDTLNRRPALGAFKKCMKAMEAPRGKLAVRGNWDHWYWRDVPLLAGTGFGWLEGEKVTLEVRGRTVHLVGFPYEDGEDAAKAEHMLASLPAKDWRIFLYHTPDLFYRVPSSDLYLAGHTHGGQIAVPFYGAFVTLSAFGKTFERGLKHMDGRWIYINPGIGVEPSVPLRLGVRPEVTLVLLGDKA